MYGRPDGSPVFLSGQKERATHRVAPTNPKCDPSRLRHLSNSQLAFGATLLIAYSASAVIVRLGFTPGFAGMIEPSTM